MGNERITGVRVGDAARCCGTVEPWRGIDRFHTMKVRPTSRVLIMWQAFQLMLVYGCLGLLVEVLFTGVMSVLRRDLRARAQTYLWMLPIYGVGGLVLEQLHRYLVWHPVALAVASVPIIYVLEFVSGWVLRLSIGQCPWDYGSARFAIRGLIRVDYAPFWLLLALAFYPLRSKIQFVVAGW